MDNLALQYMIQGSILQSITDLNSENKFLKFEFRKGSQVFHLSIEVDDSSDVSLIEKVEELKSLVGTEIQSFDINEKEYVVEDKGDMNWAIYRFQGESGFATLNFESFADTVVKIKDDKIETDTF